MTEEQEKIELACWTIMDRENFAPRTAQHTAAVICLAPHIERGFRASAREMASIFIDNQPMGLETLDKCVAAGTTAMMETP